MNRSPSHIIHLSLMMIPLLLAGCAAPVKEQPPSGFLSRYDQLEQTRDRFYEFYDPSLSSYKSFLIETPEILFEVDPEQWSEEDLEEIKGYFVERLEKELTKDDGYAVVQQPGPGVACLRVGLTALDASNGALNLSIYTKITGAGLGGAAMEAELVDTETGKQLAALLAWGNGSRVLRAGLTRLGDAKLQINRWSAGLRKSLDALAEADTSAEI
ncbi:MAG: DUF3313 domain-containing protein [Pseudomonadota bacterium]